MSICGEWPKLHVCCSVEHSGGWGSGRGTQVQWGVGGPGVAGHAGTTLYEIAAVPVHAGCPAKVSFFTRDHGGKLSELKQ